MAQVKKNNPKPALSHIKKAEDTESEIKSVEPVKKEEELENSTQEIQKVEKKEQIAPKVQKKEEDIYVANSSVSNFRSKTKYFTKVNGQIKTIVFQGGVARATDSNSRKLLGAIQKRFPRYVEKGTPANIPDSETKRDKDLKRAIIMHIPDKSLQKEALRRLSIKN